LGSPDAAEIRLGYSPVAKRNGIKLFSLIPKGIQQNLLVLQPGETTSSKFFGLQVHFSRLSRQQMP
jgi:hypothetical protein